MESGRGRWMRRGTLPGGWECDVGSQPPGLRGRHYPEKGVAAMKSLNASFLMAVLYGLVGYFVMRLILGRLMWKLWEIFYLTP